MLLSFMVLRRHHEIEAEIGRLRQKARETSLVIQLKLDHKNKRNELKKIQRYILRTRLSDAFFYENHRVRYG